MAVERTTTVSPGLWKSNCSSFATVGQLVDMNLKDKRPIVGLKCQARVRGSLVLPSAELGVAGKEADLGGNTASSFWDGL